MTDKPETPAAEEPDYIVVMNHEEQYSIWPAGREVPNGWTATGARGSESECLAHIEEVWTDMRPLSLRRADVTDGDVAADD